MEMITGIHNCQNAENNWPQGAQPQLIHLQHNPYTEGSGSVTEVWGKKIVIARGPRYLSSRRSYLLHDWEAVLMKSQNYGHIKKTCTMTAPIDKPTRMEEMSQCLIPG